MFCHNPCVKDFWLIYKLINLFGGRAALVAFSQSHRIIATDFTPISPCDWLKPTYAVKGPTAFG